MKSMSLSTIATALMMAMPLYAQSADPAQPKVENDKLTTNAEKKVEADDDIEIIAVTGVYQADLKARAMERDSKAFSSVIATDDMGNFVDQNVAESLRRIPGVTLERSEGEGKYIAVRGLGPKFVSVSMNGAELSGAGDDRKIGLDGITSDSLGAIEVFKTLTPDMNLNSIGGAVNVKAISAYERGKNTLKIKLQDSYNELREEQSPKFSLDGTQLFLDEKIGVGFALSYEDRKTQVDEVRHHSTRELNFLQGGIGLSEEELSVAPEILIPAQLENRREIADRERTTATINVEFKPNEDSFYYIRGNYSNYTDGDVAQREFYNFYNGDLADEVIYVNPQTKEFALSDIDVFNQYFIQEGETTTTNYSFGGENYFADTWRVDYEYAYSKTDDESVGDRRAQFRERENIVYGQARRDNIIAKVLTPAEAAALGGFALKDDEDVFAGEADGDLSDLSNMEYDNLFMEDSTRTDEITSIKLNLQKDFNYEYLNFVKIGGTYNQREHYNNKDRWSYTVDSADCGGDQTCMDVATSNITDYNYAVPEGDLFTYPFVSQQDVEYIVNSTKITRDSATGGEESIDSTKEDYTLTEDTYAAYVMAEIPLSEQLTVITGVRYAHTEFSSTGFMSLENDDWNFGNDKMLDIAVPLPESSITYSEFFPSLHVRYEPSDTVLVRTSLWTSYTRPSFKQARGFAKFDDDISLCDPTTNECFSTPDGQSAIELQGYILGPDNSVQVGNPNLVAMTSDNFDASFGWYPSKELFMEAAVFYKNIDNFIVDVTGIQMGIDELPLTLPVNQVSDFAIPQDLVLNQVDITLNGDKATVYGIELSYNQFFDNGLFWQSNMTFVESEAELDATIRQSKMQLPGQADMTGNISVGWENESFSFRLISNYRSDILEEVGSCPVSASLSDPHACKSWADIYQDDILTFDMKVKYDFTKNLTVYFDAINLTDESDLRYFKGNDLAGGEILYQREDYGRTFQLGMNYKFY
ncbi:TonB-dependent receptor [Pseudoalteromonas sp. S1727]|uniref:TonB-dependent receptor n=1 Tax=Pseudoalteromonas sp. S1727 TaxID=2066514 RepID=UPI001109A7B1|nr:TonB-dependent receptor [Pseudoalteromonas sp. S1727]TMN69717.1 TonB-dependent receptor [Pseudoalteromonas sp. S1727]